MLRSVALVLVAACSTKGLPDAGPTAWREGTHLPDVPRLEAGVTAIGTRLAVVGGFDSDLAAGLDITDRADLYDTLSDTWLVLPPLPVKWTHLQLASVGSMLYVLGGLEGQQFVARGETWAIDTSMTTPVWIDKRPMTAGLERGAAAVVTIPPNIYLIGGATTTGSRADVAYYNVESNEWCPGLACTAPLPDLPAARSHPAAMVRLDGALVVAGGLATLDSSSAAGDTYLLTPGATAWQTKAPMLAARGGCAYGALQGQLVCAGGEAGTSALSSVESYDPIGDAWTSLDPLPEPRAGTLGASIGQQLYVPGGARRLQFEPLQTVYVFAPLDTSKR